MIGLWVFMGLKTGHGFIYKRIWSFTKNNRLAAQQPPFKE
jgi:hypothetical protein